MGIFNIHSVAKHQKKCRGDPLGKNFFSKKKSRSAEKMERGSLWSRPVFCRTFVELFWSVRVDRKKVTLIVAFHFMKRRLKIGSKEINVLQYILEKLDLELSLRLSLRLYLDSLRYQFVCFKYYLVGGSQVSAFLLN